MAKISKEEIKNLNGKDYEIEQAGWNGNGWNSESGYFTDNGVVRFAGTNMEIFETYDEIDDDILQDCIDNIVDDDECEDEDEALKDVDEFIKNLENGKKEDEAMQNGLNFLLNQWKTNKKWFREQSGRVTTEDVIKRTFEFAWASKRNFDYQQENNN